MFSGLPGTRLPSQSRLWLMRAMGWTLSQQLQARTNIGMSTEVGKIEMWPTSDLQPGRLRCDQASYSRTGVYANLLSFLVKSGTATFTNGSTSVGMTAHGRSIGDNIKLFSTGSLPTNFTAGTHGLATAGTSYFINSVIDANTVTLSTTVGGSNISAGSSGSGTDTWVCAPHGDGDGSTTFTVPDYRGDFLRAWDTGAGVDSNRAIGNVQLDAMQGHIHSGTFAFAANSQASTTSNGFTGGSNNTGGPVSDGTNGTPRTAAETRPRNVSVNVTIRYSA